MVAVAQRSRRQVVALKIEGSIPSSHPKFTFGGKFQTTHTNYQTNPNFQFASSRYSLFKTHYSQHITVNLIRFQPVAYSRFCDNDLRAARIRFNLSPQVADIYS